MTTQFLPRNGMILLFVLCFSSITATAQNTFWTLKSTDTNGAPLSSLIQDKGYDSLYVNNVNALFNASGLHFFFKKARFEVPKGSGKTTVFSNSLWIGGKDIQNLLHFAGERYRQGPDFSFAGTKPDFYVGPVMDSINYSSHQDTVWNYIWNLTRSDIEYHRTHYLQPGYTPVHDILTWPGNGDPGLGQAPRLAPFFDLNGDGIYDPYDGDYPEIRGDQALFFIFNDDRGEHLESTGQKLRIEIHGMAYAFNIPGDSALNNTVFLNYRIYNRSQNIYDSTFLGVYTDIDLGYPYDDYIGCDAERNMYYGYNGTLIDGSGQPEAYGENPPTQSVIILAGPYMDPDGLDNPRYDLNGNQLCDASVNGLNFGDSVVDNERLGLQRFIYFNNSTSGVPEYMTDPNYAPEYYQLMNGKWRDSTDIIYGGNGHPSSGGYGPACHFMFPGESDTLNWGVGCVPPNGPKNWTESTAANAPGDRRGLGVTGPFTFKPGDVQDLDIAFGWARDYTPGNPLGSLTKLRSMTDEVNNAFATNRLPDGKNFLGVNENLKTNQNTVKIYPNPSSDLINIAFKIESHKVNATIELITTQGSCIKRMVATGYPNPVRLEISDIQSGIYFIRVMTKESLVVKKVVIIH
ncbi:MAG: T9SS type A sorting domain-containing protein [Bacteroidetes bacterium]|nr:T9SS type A sorting domain-containing protein [Bacteroidota bacterium]